MSAAQTLREQKIARAVDREIAPVWHDRFARLIWKNLPSPQEGLVLDVHHGPGRTTRELLGRLAPNVRVIGLEPSAAMRSLAKARVTPQWSDRVYLKPGDLTDVADMPEGAYDLVIANLVLGEAHDLEAALRGLVRVTKPGGTLLATLPMEGSWGEAEDLLGEVLRDAGMSSAAQRLRRIRRRRPSGAEAAAVIRGLGIGLDNFVVEQERFRLLFGSGREFLFSPLVEHGPLRLWKAVIATEGDPQELFFRFKEAIDTYYADRVFSVTALAGLLRLRVPQDGEAGAYGAVEMAGEHWRRFPTLDALWQRAEQNSEPDVDIDIDMEEPAPPSTDDSLLALLDQPADTESSAELDALLDQVLEFEPKPELIQELEDGELEEIEPEPKRAGETLKRIRALLPPPPVVPPPPPKKP